MLGAADRRLAVIGLDAAQWSLVESMIEDGELPNVAALRQRSAFARLRHADYRSGLVWEHFLTGRGVAGSGRWSAVRFDPSTYEVEKDGALPHTPFFAGIAGQTICFDVPYLSLASVGDAIAVTAWGGHDPAYPRASVPPGLLREIESRFGPHPAFDNDYAIVWHRPDALAALAAALVDGAHRRADIARWLMDRFPDWRLFVTVLSEPHSGAEQLWHGMARDYPVSTIVDADPAGEALCDIYRAVDDGVGRIIEALPDDTTVVVFSMHGTGTNDADVASMALLPELLHRLHRGEPFLRDIDHEAWDRECRPLMVPHPEQSWDSYMADRVPRPGLVKARRGWRRALTRMRAATAARLRRVRRVGRAARTPRLGALGNPIAEETTATPEEIGIPTDPIGWQLACRYQRFWPEMRAFAIPTFYDGRVRINLAGRERDGVVAREDYDAACQEVEDTVRACRDPRSGEPVVREVIRLRAEDPWMPGGPDADLQIVWSRPVDAIEHPEAGIIGPYPFRRPGGHTPDGFAFIAGPGIAPTDRGEHDALAITATIVSLAGGAHDGLEAEPLPLDRI